MNNKMLLKLNTTKKKACAIVLGTALIAALGTGTVFAASSRNILQVKMENGVRSYSTDDGKTWSQEAPKGVKVYEEDGKVTFTKESPSKDGRGKGLLSKVEDGVRYFSTDNGMTWSQEVPDNVTIEDKDGKITVTNGVLTEDGEANAMLIKIEDGIRYYSTDGGKSWSLTAPEGVAVNEDGSVTFKSN